MHESIKVHSSAFVDDGALLGKGTKVWHFSHISSGAIVGDNCSIGQNVFIAPNVVVGNNVKIQNNVSLYEGVILEDYVFCGPSMVFTNVLTPRSAFPRNTSKDYHITRIKYGASLGANSTVVCGHTIGEWAFVGAGAVITKDVLPYSLMLGVPASRKGWACECGATLPFSQSGITTCSDCGKKYSLEDNFKITRME